MASPAVRPNRRPQLTVAARARSRGAMLLLVMFLIAFIGIMLAVAGPVWRTEMQRDREADLLWMGEQYATAIGRYYEASPPPVRQYPKRLDQLLLDERQQNTQRYLRQLYRDPFTGSKEWGLIKDGSGRIQGVHSLGTGHPLKESGVGPGGAKLSSKAATYADWLFVAKPKQAAAAAAQPGAGKAGVSGPGAAMAPAAAPGAAEVEMPPGGTE